jgi:Flp pilus assembly protein TadG
MIILEEEESSKHPGFRDHSLGHPSGHTRPFRRLTLRSCWQKEVAGGRRGNAVVEVALMAPWIFLLFLGVFDFGFYAYAAISTQHAARVAALYTSSSPSTAADSGGACYYVLQSLQDLPNVGTSVTTCAGLPVQVSANAVTGADGSQASQVSVTYQSIGLFPIPGLMGQMTITRTAQVRLQ